MKISREQWQIVIALCITGMVSTFLLGLIDLATQEPIAQAKRDALTRSLTQVLPQHRNDVLNDAYQWQAPGQKAKTLYIARDTKDDVVGIAWETIAPDGYSGSIRILIGLHPDGTIYAIRVTDHRETPGLGDGISKDSTWLSRFQQRNLANTHWAVKRDGGDFDQFTGATISPRAVVREVHKQLQWFATHRASLLTPANETQHE